MKILLFGKHGQVGWELNRSLLPLGEIVALGRADADFSNPETLRKIVRNIRPDVIVNAAAYTAVDKAETEEGVATIINSVAPGILAEEAREINALLIHYSTDYVFDGSKSGPYVETDTPNPVNAYGRSKLAGEKMISLNECDYLILRTSWVYAARGNNFLKTIMRLANEKKELRIVADQCGSPTSARSIADATAHVIIKAQHERQVGMFSSGIYHLCASGKTTWYEFSSSIIQRISQFADERSIVTERVLPIATEDYPLPALRPANSQLDSSLFMAHFGLIMPNWQDAMMLCIEEVMAR